MGRGWWGWSIASLSVPPPPSPACTSATCPCVKPSAVQSGRVPGQGEGEVGVGLGWMRGGIGTPSGCAALSANCGCAVVGPFSRSGRERFRGWPEACAWDEIAAEAGKAAARGMQAVRLRRPSAGVHRRGWAFSFGHVPVHAGLPAFFVLCFFAAASASLRSLFASPASSAPLQLALSFSSPLAPLQIWRST